MELQAVKNQFNSQIKIPQVSSLNFPLGCRPRHYFTVGAHAEIPNNKAPCVPGRNRLKPATGRSVPLVSSQYTGSTEEAIHR